jgi:hypothetical protein
MFVMPDEDGFPLDDFHLQFREDQSTYRVTSYLRFMGISSHSGMANVRRLIHALQLKTDIVMEWDVVFLHSGIQPGAPLFDNVAEDPQFHYRGFVHFPYIFPQEISEALVDASDAVKTIEGGYADRFTYALFQKGDMMDWIRNHNLLKDGRVYTQNTIEPIHYPEMTQMARSGFRPFAVHGVKSPETLAQTISIFR